MICENIRTWNGSKNNAFEELVCQLAFHSKPTEGSKYTPINGSGGDGGVESYWTLPNGDEHGWQAKLFYGLTDVQWRQIERSVQTAISKHPNLVKYIVSLPINLTEEQRIKWNTKVADWSKQLDASCKFVVFELWDESFIINLLSKPENCGMRSFWFEQDEFTLDQLRCRFNEVRAAIGPRYTPEANVGVDVGKELGALELSDEFRGHVFELASALHQVRTRANNGVSKYPYMASSYEYVDVEFIKIERFLWSWGSSSVYDDLPIPAVCLQVTVNLYTMVSDVMDQLQNLIPADIQDQVQYSTAKEEYERLHNLVREVTHVVDEIEYFIRSSGFESAASRTLVIEGDAGSGKTHALCDFADTRLRNGRPTVVLLGDWFDKQSPWLVIANLMGVQKSSTDHLLGSLQSMAEACASRFVIVIDAVNESNDRCIWKTHLPMMSEALSRYPGLALLISCRSTYLKEVTPEGGFLSCNFHSIRHYGFSGSVAIGEAVKKYCELFGTSMPIEQMMQPEFNNPLFVRFYCSCLNGQYLPGSVRGVKGISAVYRQYVNSINKRLSHESLLDYDTADDFVMKAVRMIASTMANNGSSWLLKSEAKRIIDSVLPTDKGYSKTLYCNLIRENVIVETEAQIYNHDTKRLIVKFAYEWFADHMVVKALLQGHETLNSFTLSCKSDDTVKCLLTSRGYLDALAIQIPEAYGCELMDAIDGISCEDGMKQAFLHSLAWRDIDSYSEQTHQCLNEIYATDKDIVYHAILTISYECGHPYNAIYLHNLLRPMEMAERDAIWSIYLHKVYQEDGNIIKRLIDRAWHSDVTAVSIDQRSLYGITLAWFLTTSHRELRDRSTKALVSLLHRCPNLMADLLVSFHDIDDLYLLERLYAAAYGIAMLTDDLDGLKELAMIVYKQVFEIGKPIPHILLRDYARGVIEVAAQKGLLIGEVDITVVRPPYHSEWPLTDYDDDELVRLKESSNSAYRIYGSVMGSPTGDFNHYVIKDIWLSQLISDQFGCNAAAHDHFISMLSRKRKYQFDRIEHPLGSMTIAQFLEDAKISDIYPDSTLSRIVDTDVDIQTFLESLNRDQRAFYNEYVAPYRISHRAGMFSKKRICRWILNHVFELGWKEELFGDFDMLKHIGYERRGHKPERIGKKYQWIAYHECLAYLADHLMVESSVNYGHPEIYHSPVQIGVRDIDPSFLQGDVAIGSSAKCAHNWSSRVQFDFTCNAQMSDEEWLMSVDDFPSLEEIIILTNPDGCVKWASLCSNHKWNNTTCLSSYDDKHRFVWIDVRSVLVKHNDADVAFRKLNKFDHTSGLYSNVPCIDDIYIGEYPWGDSCSKYLSLEQWEISYGKKKIPVYGTAVSYSEMSEYDCSTIDLSSKVLLPSRSLMETANIRWSHDGIRYLDCSNTVVVDCHNWEDENGTLLMRKDAVEEMLSTAEYDLVWLISARKGVSGVRISGRGEMGISGAFRMRNGALQGTLRAFYQNYNADKPNTTSSKVIRTLP